MTGKTYLIAGHRIRVVLEEPWGFKALSEAQQEMVKILAAGGDLGIRPVPADKWDELPDNERALGKEPMTRSRWETMSEAEQERFRHELDLFQYAPFEVPDDPSGALFTLTVRDEQPEWLEAVLPALQARRPGQPAAGLPEGWKPVVAVDEELPIYYGYRVDGRTVYTYFPREDRCAGIFVLEADWHSGTYYPAAWTGSRTTQMQLSTSLMIAYTFATASLGTVLLHASVIRFGGTAQLHFGVSGTGKSTHSRLWLEHVPGTDLMNDDNPVIRVGEDGRATVYGSPWSGKTVCYRNVSAPVRALIRLEQAPKNRIVRLTSLSAYASVVAAVSTIRWDSSVMDALVPTVERLAMSVPCFNLSCRPDAEAVEVCKKAVL